MTLREALEAVKNSIVPGAITEDGKSYVFLNEDNASETPYSYIADMESFVKEMYLLSDEQLDRLVLFATSSIWIPVSNYRF